MTFEDYDGRGLPLRSCDNMRKPHHAHPWDHPREGRAHCWGRNPLPADTEAKYCTVGCDCDHCSDIRKGLWPRTVMCSKRWDELPWAKKEQIADSISG